MFNNNNKDIKTRLMRKVGKLSVNSENIDEEETKEENNNNNYNNNRIYYEIDENAEDNNSINKSSKNSFKQNGRFRGKRGLQVSSLSFNRSILGGKLIIIKILIMIIKIIIIL